MNRPSEAETEAKFIYPIIDALGWQHLPQQEPGRGRRDIADALLFVDEPASQPPPAHSPVRRAPRHTGFADSSKAALVPNQWPSRSAVSPVIARLP